MILNLSLQHPARWIARSFSAISSFVMAALSSGCSPIFSWAFRICGTGKRAVAWVESCSNFGSLGVGMARSALADTAISQMPELNLWLVDRPRPRTKI
jgi:hypothetical protein